MLSQQRTLRTAHIASLILSGVVAAIGLTVLAGWFFHLPVLWRVVPGYGSMNPVTACCLLVLSLALALLRDSDVAKSRRRIGQLLAAIVVALGAVRLLAIYSPWHLPIDQWLFASQLEDPVEPPSRIAVRAAISLVLSGCALLVLDVQTRRGVHLPRRGGHRRARALAPAARPAPADSPRRAPARR